VSDARSKPTKKQPATPKPRLLTPYDPLTSLVLIVPVFLVYHLGILGLNIRNGTDLVSGLFMELLDRSLAGYVGVTLFVAVGLVVAGVVLRRRDKEVRPLAFGPILLESTILAFLMMFLVNWTMNKLFLADLELLQSGPPAMNPFAKVVMAAGAGLHEELTFRVILFGGMGAGLVRLTKMKPWLAWLLAGVVSSLLFSGIHYVGNLADDFSVTSFVFRALAGGFLAAVYKLRGFAVAVYTHAIYDLIVFFFFA